MDARIRIDPYFHPGQKQVHDSPARFKVIAAGRRWGKTKLGMAECLDCALGITYEPDGTPIVSEEGGRAWWVAPTYPIAMEGWRPLSRYLNKFPKICTVREGDKEVRFKNNGLIQVRSADDPQRLRGAGLDLLIMDEAAFVKDIAWNEVLRPALSDRQGRGIFISTPKGHNWFYDLYEDAAKLDGWARFQFPTASNPHIPAGEIEVAQREVGSLIFSQEYLAEFVAAGGIVFNPEWFTYHTPRTHAEGYKQYVLPSGEAVDGRETTRYCTVDLAASVKESADYTVIMSFAVWKQWILVIDVMRKRLEGPTIVPAIQKIVKDHDLDSVHMESAGFQLTLVQEARSRGLPVKKLIADKDKLARAMPAAARMEQQQILWPKEAAWAADLERELQLFTGVQAEHDDQVDTLAYGVRVASKLGRKTFDGVWPDDLRRSSPNRV